MRDDDLMRHIERTAIIREGRHWLHLAHRIQFLAFRKDMETMRAAIVDCIDDYLSMNPVRIAHVSVCSQFRLQLHHSRHSACSMLKPQVSAAR